MCDLGEVLHGLRINSYHEAADLIEQLQQRIAELERYNVRLANESHEKDLKIDELAAAVERMKAQQSEVALNAYAVAYKEGFGDGLETDKYTIDEINRTASSINLYEYNLHNIAKYKAYKYANQLREQGDE